MQGASKGMPRKKYTKNTQDTQEDPTHSPKVKALGLHLHTC